MALFLKYGAVKTAVLFRRLGSNCIIKVTPTTDLSRLSPEFEGQYWHEIGLIRYGLFFNYTSNDVQCFGVETWGKEIFLEDLGVDGRIILKWIFSKWNGEAWTFFAVAHDRDKWRAVANTVMNLGVLLCSMYLYLTSVKYLRSPY
jgi:hypothetical protein